MKPLEIIVLVKPVPDPARWDRLKLDPESMLLDRNEVPPVINPLDRHAIEQGLVLKLQTSGSVIALTMAPPSAEEQLREALALGCDEAYLLTDPLFAGADSLATAKCLVAAIRKIGSFDLVFGGSYSMDGSTAQLGPQIAELLGIPDLTHTVRLEYESSVIRARCRRDQGAVTYETELPALVTFDKEINKPRIANMVGIGQAATKKITKWNAKDIPIKKDEIGLVGSPTQMLGIFAPDIAKKGEILKGPANEIVNDLIVKLHQKKVLTLEGRTS